MHNCEEILVHIYEFINSHDLTQELNVEIRGHLQHCRKCYSRYEFERRLLERMKDSAQTACPDSLKQKIRNIVENF